MSRQHLSRLLLSLAVAVTCVTLTPDASAQSEAELRRENERLRTRVSDLQRELDNALAVNKELRKEIDELKRLLADAQRGGSRGPIPDLPPEKVSIDESVPSASPRALLAAMKKSYEEAMKDLSLSEDERLFHRTLGTWTTRVNREMKARITWHVKVQDYEPGPRGSVLLRLEAVDPRTGTVLGSPFTAGLDRGTAHRLEKAVERTGLMGQVLVLNGTLIPRATPNRERASAGAFDHPPLIGPYAEFMFDVEARSLVPPSPEDENAEEKDKGKSGTGNRVDR